MDSSEDDEATKKARPAWPPLCEHSKSALLFVVADKALGSSGNPAASSAGGGCNSDQKNWVIARSRHTCNLAGEVSIAVHVERDRHRVENDYGRATGMARSSAGIAAIEDQSADIKERSSGGKIHLCAAAKSHRRRSSSEQSSRRCPTQVQKMRTSK